MYTTTMGRCLDTLGRVGSLVLALLLAQSVLPAFHQTTHSIQSVSDASGHGPHRAPARDDERDKGHCPICLALAAGRVIGLDLDVAPSCHDAGGFSTSVATCTSRLPAGVEAGTLGARGPPLS